MQPLGCDVRRKPGAVLRLQQKKARSGSGLNLSLEENRGDMSIMLHRKIEIQFIFAMIVIDGLNNTAETA
jgi:hypothetical protein